MSPERQTGNRAREIVSSPRVRRVVVKLGSGTVTDPEKGLREPTIRALAAQLSSVWSESGVSFVVVTSGAIAAGRKKLGMAERPRTVALKQAAAAVGQTSLMRAYERAFEKRGRHVAQLLLTHDDFERPGAVRQREEHASRAPRPGDRPHRERERHGGHRGDPPRGQRPPRHARHPDDRRRPADPPDRQRRACRRRTPTGIPTRAASPSWRTSTTRPSWRPWGDEFPRPAPGGWRPSCGRPRVLSASGIPVVIASGLSRRSILDILGGKDTGTLILPRRTGKLRSRKMWIAYAMNAHGTILVDDGARKVLMDGGKSLLPAGVTGSRGRFRPGDAVSIADPRGRVFARGIARWSSEQVDRGKGKRSAEVRALLGPETPAEVVHRDDLTILPYSGTPESRKGAAPR